MPRRPRWNRGEADPEPRSLKSPAKLWSSAEPGTAADSFVRRALSPAPTRSRSVCAHLPCTAWAGREPRPRPASPPRPGTTRRRRSARDVGALTSASAWDVAGPPCALPVCGWWAGLASAEAGSGGSGDFLGGRSLSCHSERTLTRVASGGTPPGPRHRCLSLLKACRTSAGAVLWLQGEEWFFVPVPVLGF